MKYYMISFGLSQVIVPCEQNLAAIFMENRNGDMHVIKDDAGKVVAAWRWQAVVGVFETQPMNAPAGGLIVPRLAN